MLDSWIDLVHSQSKICRALLYEHGELIGSNIDLVTFGQAFALGSSWFFPPERLYQIICFVDTAL
jgi:hypothetical protein